MKSKAYIFKFEHIGERQEFLHILGGKLRHACLYGWSSVRCPPHSLVSHFTKCLGEADELLGKFCMFLSCSI